MLEHLQINQRVYPSRLNKRECDSSQTSTGRHEDLVTNTTNQNKNF